MRGSRTRGPAAQYNRMTCRDPAGSGRGDRKAPAAAPHRQGRPVSQRAHAAATVVGHARGLRSVDNHGTQDRQATPQCVRVIQRGDRAYLVALRLSHIAVTSPTAVQAWVHDIWVNANVRLRIRGGDFDTGSCFAAPFSRRTPANAPCTCAACPRERKSKNCTATGSRPESRLRSIWRRYAHDHCSNCPRDRKPVSER